MAIYSSFLTDVGNWFANLWNQHGDSFLDWCKSTGMSLIKTIAILIIGFWVAAIISRMVRGTLKRSKVDKAVGGFIASCVRVGLKIIVVVMAIAALGLNITSIITALGAAGITLGLAMQDSLSNFASGVLILFNKPFVVGDYVELEQSSGTVKDISLMYTTLINTENKEVIYPNSSVTSAKIINHTALDKRRIELQFAVDADTEVAVAKEALLAAVESSPNALTGEGFTPIIGLREFGEGRIKFDLRVWIETSDYWASYYDIEERVYNEFKARSISFAREQVDVHLRNNA
ncbi:MAG: mechanosensitive ion channel [Ruminococcaceae bacterium]|nr:mechanosensitive ion channel [Oscillospiraceae bacterium]